MSAAPTAPGDFVIAVRDDEAGLLFWSNEDGFVDLAQATIFNDAETREFAMPISEDPRWLALPSRQLDVIQDGTGPVRPNTARLNLLESIYAFTSEYLLYECPDDEYREDFDADIDLFRSKISDLRDQEAEYLANLPAQPLRFVVDVEFLSGREPFATETYEVEAFNWTDAKRAAFRLADDSPFDNDSIPDLGRRAVEHTDHEPSAPK